ncbi:MAG TPA: glycerate kinase [Planctomycetota bacterium]|nr:glycerate kinase [Planctomycetota bacterium]
MRILVAPCTFKGSLSARLAAAAIARGLVSAGLEADELPLSDGGEGLVDCFLTLPGAERVEVEATGPMGRPVRAAYALLSPSTPGSQPATAVIEMAASSGLPLVPEAGRNPLLATTRGFGELILDAARRGARSLLLGIGGSATVDGGAGMAAALGVRLLDDRGRELPDGGGALERLARIDAAGLPPAIRALEIRVACDVDSPLLGPTGAARMFGPQKGATPEMVERLEVALGRMAGCVLADLDRDVAGLPGAGAAGGLGAGLVAFLGARLVPGADLVMDAVGFDARLRSARCLVTGEGALDVQSLRGKAPVAAARRAARAGVPAAALVGCARLPADEARGAGLARVWQLTELAPPADCVARAGEMLERLARCHAGEIAALAGGE